MKLKPIVASMFMLGLISGPVFAAATDASVQPQLDAMRAKVAKMEAVLEQNQSGGWQQPSDWFNRITISGQANIDAFYGNRKTTTFATGSNSGLNLSNANIFVDALLNDWTKFHGALVYQDSLNSSPDRRPLTTVNDRNMDEAYVTIGNFVRSPFYFRAGRQYVAFGDYQRYPIFESFTQLLTETQATAATVGFVNPMGFNAAIFTYSGMPKAGETRGKIRNYGGHVGFASSYDMYAYNLGLDYMRNMANVNYISAGLPGSYLNDVGGVSVNAGVATGPFDVGFRYVTALQRFNAGDLPYVVNGATRGAKPAALDVNAGYSFPVVAHQSRLGLGFQASKEANNVGDFGLPKQRYLVNYTVNVSRWVDVGFELDNDRDYGRNKFVTAQSKGGTGNNVTTGVVRLSAKFA